MNNRYFTVLELVFFAVALFWFIPVIKSDRLVDEPKRLEFSPGLSSIDRTKRRPRQQNVRWLA